MGTRKKSGLAVVTVWPGSPPVQLRLGGSDLMVFHQVFLSREYEWKTESSPQFIIDCGANVGLASIFFARKYPQARIVAVEPEHSNFDLLVKNTSVYQRIECMEAGIWNRETYLRIQDAGAEKWAFTCEETTEATGAIKAVTPRTIMDKSGQPAIDILKIDIEGSELELFSTNYEQWLPHTRVLMIELHDNMKKGCSRSFFAAILKYDFSFQVSGHGNTIICTRNG